MLSIDIFKYFLSLISSMGFFSQKSKDIELTSKEYEKLSVKITELSAKLSEIEKSSEVLKTNLSSLRGLVNRKVFNGEIDKDKDAEGTPYDEVFVGGKQ